MSKRKSSAVAMAVASLAAAATLSGRPAAAPHPAAMVDRPSLEQALPAPPRTRPLRVRNRGTAVALPTDWELRRLNSLLARART